jgi:hypothetical protein
MSSISRPFLLVVLLHFSSSADAQQPAFDEAHGSPDCPCINPWAGLPANSSCSNVTKGGHTTCLP